MAEPTTHQSQAPDAPVYSPVDEIVEISVGAAAFDGPEDVLTCPTLSTTKKRAILASWASDACAVEGMPAYRELPGTGRVVCVDDILEALRALDATDLH